MGHEINRRARARGVWRGVAVVAVLAVGTGAAVAQPLIFRMPAGGAPGGDAVADAAWCDVNPCPEMVFIPAGSFLMGSPLTEPGRDENEDDDPGAVGSQVSVTIGTSFAVGKYEVTFAQWDACVTDGGCGGHTPSDQTWGRGDQPVIDVSWDDAQSYVSWLSDKTGHTYRLLTEAEWEYVARAGTTTPFWWGNTINESQANYDCTTVYEGGGETCTAGVGRTQPVGTYAANPFGLHDVNGNVWEWVEDCWNDSYNNAPTDGSGKTTGDCSYRVLRGGSWYPEPRDLRSANRGRNTTDLRGSDLGFRVARTL